MKEKLRKLRKILISSLLCILVVASISLLYGYISLGFFTLRFVFPAVFLIGALITAIGVIVTFMPVRVQSKDNKLIDHTTYFSAVMEKREYNRETARMVLYFGISIITIAAAVQWILSLVL